MILYYDNLITDVPLRKKGTYSELDEIRNSDSAYKFKSRFDVALYTLASYAEIEWSHVIIKYELQPDDSGKRRKFEKFVKRLFPKAHIIYGRSDNQKKFMETIKLINTLDDDLVFYAGNNDHVFVAPDTKTLYSCVEGAKRLCKKHRYVSIIYSHFVENSNLVRCGNVMHKLYGNNIKKIFEVEEYTACLFPRGFFPSVQIVSKSLLNRWFGSENLDGLTIKRSDDLENYTKVKNQIVIMPKDELFSHFDGYTHNKIIGFKLLPSDKIPPLFIPDGFFENKIKIAYGYEKYKKGFVNINPLKEKYSFRDSKNGTDLMISLNKMPLFWKKRISKTDINQKVDKEKVNKVLEVKRKDGMKLNFPNKSKLFYFWYRNYINFPESVFYIFPRVLYSKFRKIGILKKIYTNSFRKHYGKLDKKFSGD